MASLPPESDGSANLPPDLNEAKDEVSVGSCPGDSFGGARPKVSRLNEAHDKCQKSQTPSNSNTRELTYSKGVVWTAEEVSEPEESVKLDHEVDDFYVYVHEEHEADLPKSFYLIDASSDSESSTTQQVDPGPGPGQSNVSNEVAAALKIKRKMASNKGKRALPIRPPSGRESPDMDFLEMDFNPSDSDDEQPAANDAHDSLNHDVIQDRANLSNQENENETISEERNSSVPVDKQSTADNLANPIGSASMVRSQSLIYSKSKEEHLSECCMIRGESDPGNFYQTVHCGENLLFGRWMSNAISALPKSPEFRRNIENVKNDISCERLLQRKKVYLARTNESKSKNGLVDVKGNTNGDIRIQKTLEQPTTATEDSTEKVERMMVWNEAEAFEMQVSNACLCDCGADSVFNVLRALKWPDKKDQVLSQMPSHQRGDTSRLPQYLFSRSSCATTATDLVKSIETISEGKIFGRFFKTYPERNIQLNMWLSNWIKLGAIPLVTSNPQCESEQDGQIFLDSWYHRMVFGVDNEYIYLTSPFESVLVDRLHRQLISPSDLLVSRNDVLSRTLNKFGKIYSNCNLRLLECHPDERWDRYNVLGQVVNMVRENSYNWTRTSPSPARPYESAFIRIPTILEPGITLFVHTENKNCLEKLENEPELTIKSGTENFHRHD